MRNGVRSYCYYCDSKRTRNDTECIRTTIQEVPFMEAVKNVTGRQLQMIGAVLEQGRLVPGSGKEGGTGFGKETGILFAEARERELGDALLSIRENRQQLYEGWKEGRLSPPDYEYRKEQLAKKQTQYEEEQAELKIRIERIKEEQANMAVLESCYEKTMETGGVDIPFTVLDALIEKIAVLSTERIDITFTYSDFMEEWCKNAQPGPVSGG